MEIRMLKYFLMVAAEQNITRAAKQLNITQPTLSRQIKEFEDSLGTDLFIRQNKKMYLTESGLFLKQRAEEIIELSDKTEQEFLNKQSSLLSGHISVGCVEASSSDFLAETLGTMLAEHPQVTFTMFSGTSDDIMERLDKGLLDLALLIEPTTVAKYEKLPLLQKEVWGLVVSRESFLANKQQITPTDLVGIPLLTSNREEVLNMLSSWSHQPLTSLNIVGRYNLIFNVMSLVASKVGSAVAISGAAAAEKNEQIQFLPFSPALETHCVLVWRKNTLLSPTVHTYIQTIKHALKAYNPA